MNILLITYNILPLVKSSNVDNNFLWNATLFFLGLGLLYLAFIFFFKSRFSARSIKKASKRSELAPIISNFLFHSSQDSKDEQKEYVNLKIEIREYLKDSSFRNILAEILFDLQKDVSGTTEERLFKLYRELGLHHDAFAKLKSWRWAIISKGILELTQMQVGESYQLITKYINDKRSTVRKQAEIATIKLRNEGINYILDSTIYPISEWQQLKMIEALSTLKDYQPPKFKAWLISENKDVVLFSLRLIKHYNQNDAAASIIELVKHKDNQIKLAAIQCIKDFNFIEAKATLRAVFLDCTDEVKIQILGAIAIFGDESDIPFLNGVAIKESNFLVNSKARSAINNITPDSVLPKKDIIKPKGLDKELELETLEKEPTVIESDENTKILISEEYLEIETIDETEIYELDDSASLETESIENIDEDIVKKEPSNKVSFDFEVMDEKTNSSLDEELGLLSSESLEQEQLDDSYNEMNYEEKDLHLEEIGDTVSAKQVEFLERVMEDEPESELRFKAFKKLKYLKTNFPIKKIIEKEKTTIVTEETSEPEERIGVENLSIFYPLYQKANDLNSKLILIEQMGSLGDEKELGFLKTLLNSEEVKVNKAVKTTIKKLEDKYSSIQEEDSIDNEKPEVITEDLVLDNIKSESVEITSAIQPEEDVVISFEANDEEIVPDNRLPLELCFLYDEFGIQASKSEENDFDFELSEEFFLNLNNKKEEHEH